MTATTDPRSARTMTATQSPEADMSTTTIDPPTASSITPGAELAATLQHAGQLVAPVWPLDRYVAVNPYLGLAGRPFGEAAAQLSDAAGVRTTMDAAWYLDAVSSGRIDPEAISAALVAQGRPTEAADVDGFLARVADLPARPHAARTPTVAGVATGITGSDWSRLRTDRISAWASAAFDHGHAVWRSANSDEGPFASWKDEASIDRTPEIMGLRGFRRTVRSLPDDPIAAAATAVDRLGISAEQLPSYLHALLLQVGGWAAYCARIDFEADLAGATGTCLVEFQAILLSWELALLDALQPRGVDRAWSEALLGDQWSPPSIDSALADELVLQDALDRSEQARLVGQLAPARRVPGAKAPRADAQAVFCIDVRSEVLRRHVEAASDARVETLGFAGFFAMAIEFVPLAHEHGSAQCPALITPGHTVRETLTDPDEQHRAVDRRRLSHHVRRSWKSFKMGAISCFSFVGPVGLLYLPKLFTDSSGRTRPSHRPETEGLSSAEAAGLVPSLDPVGPGNGIALPARIDLAEGALRAMSLHDDLAPLVAFVGHGASTVNNPYDNSLHCGACGGQRGDANARVAAAILNDPDVRTGLAARGLHVPADTWFLGGLHDTTTDEVTIFDQQLVPADHQAALHDLLDSFAAAGRHARRERAPRLGVIDERDPHADVLRRSNDWAQVRPEWGLAGCRAFIVAPRHRTADLDLEGRSFLHSYDWRRDEGFGVLEAILTAPVVVGSWISLQYFASTVEPDRFGSGNKTLHNVVGRLGVLEGNAGDLRVGLPWQSVHDGHRFQHEPLKMNVVVEAPLDAMAAVLAAHQHVEDLCANGWMCLLAMGDDGAVSHRYVGAGTWEPVPATA